MKVNGTKLTCPEARLSYCNLWEPHVPSNGSPDAKPQYDVQLLIPKTAEFKAAYDKCVAAAKTAFLAKNPGVKLPSVLKDTLHDGDGEKPNGGSYNPECKGCYVINTKTYTKPLLLKLEAGRKVSITDANDLYSGCYGQAVLDFFVYSGQSKGVTAFINGLLKTRDGEPLSGPSVSADDFDFESSEEENPFDDFM